jgi:hypothetical protein
MRASAKRSKKVLIRVKSDRHLDPMANLRELLEGTAGVLPMGCGCFIHVDPKALGGPHIDKVIDAACHAAGTCPHQHQH